MTNLNLHLPLEDIQKSEKLMGMNTKLYWAEGHYDDYILVKIEDYKDFDWNSTDYYPAPTISDVLNNAEELFGNKMIEIDFGYWDKEFISKQDDIFRMCQQDKTIKEISEYILKNIK